MANFVSDRYASSMLGLWEQPVYGLTQSEKENVLLPLYVELHKHHLNHNESYRNIVRMGGQNNIASLEEVPYLAVRLFKHLNLKSIDSADVYRTLQSSGTTGQSPANIYLDKETSARQSKALVKILQQSIGKQRLPMLVVDSPSVLKNKQLFSARGAGIQGLSFFGRDHTYALDESMAPDWSNIELFVEKYSGQPVLIFGFTFMVWQHFIQYLKKTKRTYSFKHGTLLHSGGWKKLESKRVDNDAFKAEIDRALGIKRVHNFYGMAEQVGSVFVECAKGHLHCPVSADVIIRNPFTLEPSEVGHRGLIQVLSVLPTSYPGYSILTEDLGVCLGIDDCACGQKGKYFSVSGRLPKVDIRGCSDTYAN